MQNINAQNASINEANLQLRQLLSPLFKPNPAKNFLYDMAVHCTDSSWYVTIASDTNVTDEWFKVYEEMYHSAYDTAVLASVESIFDNANNYTNDTIPIGIMNFSYYGFKPDALTTNTYFNFDTINNILTDLNPRPSWPYTDNNTIFMSAPLINNAQFSNPTFTINPQFFYYDIYNAAHFAKNGLLKIDFGDGTGWHLYNPTVVSYYQPNYANVSAPPIIRVQTVDPSTSSILGGSMSRFFPGGVANVPPDEILVIQGLNVGIYNGCTNTGKTVIYLEGIDPLDFINSQNRNVATIYSTMLEDNRIIELRNQGYRFVVVDWQNSRIDMRFNALYVVNLIQQLKLQSPDNEQFVVIGESMGGVIARYALTYMESREYRVQSTSPFFTEISDLANVAYLATHPQILNLPTNWVLPEKMHNTRLFISMDAPHQGANVPLSIQKAYQEIMGTVGPYVSLYVTRFTKAFNLFLDSKSTNQLLIQHISTESGSGFNKTYSSHNFRNTFMAQLNELGSYPQFAKTMLMSNGALDGSNQLNPYTQRLRQANDRLLDFRVDIFGRVFGIRVPFMGCTIAARTNPDGNGRILQANAGLFAIRVKLKWFGIKVYADYNSLFNIQHYANTKPYCTSAGSHYGPGTTSLIGTNTANSYSFNLSNNIWALNLFSVNHIVDGEGCSRTNIQQGFQGFLSTNYNFSICTDGLRFGFIPTYSALDYNARGALNTNFERIPIATKLANIPARADVMVGNPSIDRRYLRGRGNREHLEFRNDEIFNLTNTSTFSPTNDFNNTYWSCINQDNRVRRGFLNLEVGDEELYLENNSLQYNAQYQVEYDLHVNERNPRYEYVSSPNPLPNTVLGGVYSKQNLFSISPTGFANFIFDDTNGPAGHNGFHGTTTGNFTLQDAPLNVCCSTFSTLARGRNIANFTLNPKVKNDENYLKISPNPLHGNCNLRLQYKFKTAGNVHLSILNLQGMQVYHKALFIPNSKLDIVSVLDVGNLPVQHGLYIVKLSNGVETLTSKVFISK